MRRPTALVGAMLLLAGCDDGTVRAIIGAEGGTLEGYGAKLVVPAGALSETRELTLRAEEGGAPVLSSLSPLYQFGPSGLKFEVPAHLDIEIPEGKSGLLYWSKPGNEKAFSVAGLAFGGKAGGLTTHFSDAYVGEGMCALPQTTKCACRADDEYFDLLCKVDPSMSGGCPDINAYTGEDGGSCSGYGPRPELHNWCLCYDTKLGLLCPEQLDLETLACPSEDAWNGFVDVGEEGASCTGYGVQFTATESEHVSGSGTLTDCYLRSAGDVYDSHSGTLEGCYVTSVPESADLSGGSEAPGPLGASDAPNNSCAPPNPTFSKECVDIVEAREKAGLKTACQPPSSLKEKDEIRDWFKDLGNEAHKAIQARFLAAYPSTGHVEVWVPNANKDEGCVIPEELEVEPASDDDPDSDYVPRDGRVDLLRIVGDVNADPLIVEIAEIKPATRGGLERGSREVYTCYEPHIDMSGPSCREPATGVEKAFCGELQAVGRTVGVKKPIGLIWGLEDSIQVTVRPGDVRTLQVISCGDGVVGYLCLEDEKGTP